MDTRSVENDTATAPSQAESNNFAGFASADELAKAYSELRTKFSRGEHKTTGAQQATTETAPRSTAVAPEPSSAGSESAPDTAPSVSPEAAPSVNRQDAQSAVKAAGLSYADLQADYARNGGQLSEESYAALEAAGIDRATVDAHTRGQEAVAREMRGQVFATVGGEEAYGDLVGWARDNLSPSEQAAYNRSVNSGDLDTIKLAVAGLQSRYQADVGVTPRLLSGRSGSGTQAHGGAFKSTAELTEAMRDPRYAADPDYRDAVRERLARSNIM